MVRRSFCFSYPLHEECGGMRGGIVWLVDDVLNVKMLAQCFWLNIGFAISWSKRFRLVNYVLIFWSYWCIMRAKFWCSSVFTSHSLMPFKPWCHNYREGLWFHLLKPAGYFHGIKNSHSFCKKYIDLLSWLFYHSRRGTTFCFISNFKIWSSKKTSVVFKKIVFFNEAMPNMLLLSWLSINLRLVAFV